MLNKVILQGNIGRAPKLCLTQDGREIINFSLATKTIWKDEMGEWQSATDWHRITIFKESTIKWVKDGLRRGDPVYVEGTLSYHQWEDKYGQSRLTPHVLVTGRNGCVKCLRQCVPEIIPSNSKVEPSLDKNSSSSVPLPDSQKKTSLSEEIFISEREDEQDIPFETSETTSH